jgi:hypothetical protein
VNKAEKQAFADYVREVADLLHLRDWDFDVYFEVPEMPDDVESGGQSWGMSVCQTRHRKHAVIRVPPDLRTSLPYQGDELKQSVAHELIHMHFAPLWDQARVDTRNDLGQSAYDYFIASFERNLEYGVDAMAEAIAPHLPDIKWPERKVKNGT